MKVYELSIDVNNFQSLFYDGEYTDAVRQRLSFDGTPKGKSWRPVPTFILEPKLDCGDFLAFVPGTIVAGERAIQATGDLLKSCCELLPLKVQGETMWIVNVTACYDVLDQKKTVWEVDDETGEKVWIERAAFVRHRMTESPLFKIPEQAHTKLYVFEQGGDPDCEFKARVEQEKLSGLIFRKVWNAK